MVIRTAETIVVVQYLLYSGILNLYVIYKHKQLRYTS